MSLAVTAVDWCTVCEWHDVSSSVNVLFVFDSGPDRRDAQLDLCRLCSNCEW